MLQVVTEPIAVTMENVWPSMVAKTVFVVRHLYFPLVTYKGCTKLG